MYLDIQHEARTNGEFAGQLHQLTSEFSVLNAKALRNSKFVEEANAKLLEITRFCNYNLFFLVPYYFPRYFNNKPLSFIDYPFVCSMLNFQIGGFTVYRGSRQISKSTGLSVRQILNGNLLPNWKSIYVCPHPTHLKTYANKLKETERAYRFYRGKSNDEMRSNLGFKEFGTGAVRSTIELLHILADASPGRGKTSDELLFDEYQNFDADFETEIGQINSATSMPCTIYAGTSTTTETALEGKFAQSSMGYYSVRCECGHVNIPLPEHGVLDMIQAQGPTCTKVYSSGKRCGKLLNVRVGEFVHAAPQMITAGRLGFHIPQIVVPGVVYNNARWAQIVDRKHGPNPSKFLQELLGIPTEQGDREITRKHLEDICIMGDMMALKRKAQAKQYEYVVSGCDWGGSDYNMSEKLKISTTVHVVMGITPLKEFDIIHMKRHVGMEYEDIIADIMATHKALNGCAIGSDYGVGLAYNKDIRRYVSPDTHLIFNYVGPKCAYIDEPHDAHMYNQWSLNKNESLTILFQAIKEKKIRCYNWEQAQALLLDFLNMYRAPQELPDGASKMVYRASATKPNDCMQAANYAYTTGKIMMGEPLFVDSSLQQRLNIALRGGAMHYAGRMNLRPISG